MVSYIYSEGKLQPSIPYQQPATMATSLTLPFKVPFPIILASGSPRRRQLLAQLGFGFQVMTRPTEETWPDDLPAEQVAEYLAKKKALAFLPDSRHTLIIAADTTVCLGNEVLNKAATEEEALSMLRKQQGQDHKVITGVAIAWQGKVESFSDTTTVSFLPMTDVELLAYIRSAAPFDKAGAYGVQEWIGMAGISSIHGSYYTVMGLPTHLLYQRLKHYCELEA